MASLPFHVHLDFDEETEDSGGAGVDCLRTKSKTKIATRNTLIEREATRNRNKVGSILETEVLDELGFERLAPRTKLCSSVVSGKTVQFGHWG